MLTRMLVCGEQVALVAGGVGVLASGRVGGKQVCGARHHHNPSRTPHPLLTVVLVIAAVQRWPLGMAHRIYHH